eukprot:TRINITY_DN35752_c0_g1_i1.p1 TRINITY_DN35752_c0_g1~~TRINITY_DN35752_c0_g1_i1.p1  ORF type:complete len:586 (+),score=137.17 TRINITY_DN35752_c0_g1_i1:84-1841(+)
MALSRPGAAAALLALLLSSADGSRKKAPAAGAVPAAEPSHRFEGRRTSWREAAPPPARREHAPPPPVRREHAAPREPTASSGGRHRRSGRSEGRSTLPQDGKGSSTTHDRESLPRSLLSLLRKVSGGASAKRHHSKDDPGRSREKAGVTHAHRVHTAEGVRQKLYQPATPPPSGPRPPRAHHSKARRHGDNSSAPVATQNATHGNATTPPPRLVAAERRQVGPAANATPVRNHSAAGGSARGGAANGTADGATASVYHLPNVTFRGNYTERVVAIGDFHGDMLSASEVLNLAGLVDEDMNWVGGTTTLVQMGDIVDKGPYSAQLCKYLGKLRSQAREAGGDVRTLMGNHELMNLQGATQYVNQKEAAAFGGRAARRAAFQASTGGEYGRTIAEFPAALELSGTFFVHAGLLPRWAKLGAHGLAQRVRAGIKKRDWSDEVFSTTDGPLWTREPLKQALRGRCELVYKALEVLNEGRVSHPVHRIVVGHSIQPVGKIALLCNERLVAIDIAISSHIDGGGYIGYLDIRGNRARPVYSYSNEVKVAATPAPVPKPQHDVRRRRDAGGASAHRKPSLRRAPGRRSDGRL